MSVNNECLLSLERLFYDKIYFERKGFKNDEELEIDIKVGLGKYNDDLDVVSLIAEGEKLNEYSIYVQVSGFFKVEENSSINKEDLLQINAVAILMPYLRRQISLLTTQPEVDSVMLPLYNINGLVKEMRKK